MEGLGGDGPLRVLGLVPDMSSAHVWRAALEAGADLGAEMLARCDAVGGPRTRIVATGGGVRGAVVRSVKESRLGPIDWSPVQEATARGAALLAGSGVVDVVGSGLR
jgi:sugar (pentulose or hexulose) kinase